LPLRRPGWPRCLARALGALVLALAACGTAHAWDDGSVPFVVSPDEVVHRMLRIAEVGPDDMLIDLGSGDGRVVSHDWDMGPWLPDETLSLRAPDKPVGGRNGLSYIHLWIVPAQVAGEWRGRIEGLGGEWRMRVRQTYQRLDVEADVSGRALVVRASRLRGGEVKLAVSGLVGGQPMNLLLAGRVEGARIEGRARTFDGQTEDERAWRATRNP
jgi:hypothetical protein